MAPIAASAAQNYPKAQMDLIFFQTEMSSRFVQRKTDSRSGSS